MDILHLATNCNIRLIYDEDLNNDPKNVIYIKRARNIINIIEYNLLYLNSIIKKDICENLYLMYVTNTSYDHSTLLKYLIYGLLNNTVFVSKNIIYLELTYIEHNILYYEKWYKDRRYVCCEYETFTIS
jgi:hypothetical protein